MLATGRVMALDSQIDTTTGTVKVRAQFDNTDNALANQFVNAQLVVKTLEQCRTVPTAAMPARGAWDLRLRRQCRQHGIGAAESRPAQPRGGTRPSNPVWRSASGGWADGTDRLRDGARVIIPGARSATPAAGHAAAEAQPPAPHNHPARRRTDPVTAANSAMPGRGGAVSRFRRSQAA